MYIEKDNDGHGSGGPPPLRLYKGCGVCGELGEIKAGEPNTWLDPCYRLEKSAVDGRTVWHQYSICPKCARWYFRYWIKVRLKWRIGWLSHLLWPGWAGCRRCNTNGAYADFHVTYFSEGCGCSALCVKCWTELTPVQRMPYYRRLHQLWLSQSHSSDVVPFEVLEKAVLGETNGKE